MMIKFPVKLEFLDNGDKKVLSMPKGWQTLEKSKPIGRSKNWAVLTGQKTDITVIDVDIKNGKNGVESLCDVGIDLDDYNTYAVKTQSGGYHYYFKYDERFKTSANIISGVDIRNDGGCVYAGDRYEILKDCEPVKLPEELYEALYLSKTEEQDDSTESAETKEYSGNINLKYYDLINRLPDEWFNDYDKWIKIIYALRNGAVDGDLSKDESYDTAYKLMKEHNEDKWGSKYESEFTRVFNAEMKYKDKRFTIGSVVNKVKAINNESFLEWKNAHSNKNKVSDDSLRVNFKRTFDSDRNVELVVKLLDQMGKTFDEFRESICDETFKQRTELAFWSDEHCVVSNCVNNDFDKDFRSFERLLKTMVFHSREIVMRFITYFIHEFYVFSSANSKVCYIRAKPTKTNSRTIRNYDIKDFTHISIRVQFGDSGGKSFKLAELLTEIPFHKFDSQCYIWNHDPSDLSAFSLAIPFKAKVLDRKVRESELLPDWLYYVKVILCYRNEEKWIWLRSYLANIIHQPNERTEVLLLLYSVEKRLGKSTLKAWLDMVFGIDNVGKVENMSDAFGVRGAPQLLGKRLAWFEELTECKNTFRACMDRMKTAITDSRTTYRKLYHEVSEIDNTNEYIAATNHLVGVLEDRFTVFKVNPERKDDREFYTKLRADLQGEETDKIITYLKDFTTSLPMKIIKTKEYESMLGNSSESIVQYIKDLKSTTDELSSANKLNTYLYADKDVVYNHYLRWCEKDNESKLAFNRFKEKICHYDPSIVYKKIKIDGACRMAFTFTNEFFNGDGILPEEE